MSMTEKLCNPERDCFRAHAVEPVTSGFLDARSLPPVDGIQPSLFIYGSKAHSSCAGSKNRRRLVKCLQIAGVKIQAQDKIYLCITGTRQFLKP
jgi:hypothetical protein